MATIRVKNTKSGTTYRIRAGKGEDLIAFVRALARQPCASGQPTNVGELGDGDPVVPSSEQPCADKETVSTETEGKDA